MISDILGRFLPLLLVSGPGNWNAVSKALHPYVAHRNSPIVVSSIENPQLQKARPNVAVMVSKCNSTSPFDLHQVEPYQSLVTRKEGRGRLFSLLRADSV